MLCAVVVLVSCALNARAEVILGCNKVARMEIFRLTNVTRAQYGLPGLALYPGLNNQASVSCNLQYYNSFIPPYYDYGHYDTQKRLTPVVRRAFPGVSTAWGENVAWSSCPPGSPGRCFNTESLQLAWIRSPSHFENIVDPRFLVMGVDCLAVVKPDGQLHIWWAVEFGGLA